MSRNSVAETEIETGIGKPRRLQERFLKGPIPLRLIARAANLSGGCLSVYLAIHHRTALTRSAKVTLPKDLLTQFGVSRDSKARALKQLDKAGLVVVENQKGKAARVMLSDEPDVGVPSVTGNSDNEQWAVIEDGIRCLKPDYFIPKSQLAELREGSDTGIAMWPLQMAAKSWVDIDAFIEAFDRGLTRHKPEGFEKIDGVVSYSKARQIAASRASKDT